MRANEFQPEKVDICGLQEEILRKDLLKTPSLFENRNDFKSITEFLNSYSAVPSIGNYYIYVSVMMIIPGGLINIAAFNETAKLIEFNDYAVFETSTGLKQYPSKDTISGDLLKHFLFFNKKTEFEKFKMLTTLKYNDMFRISYKDIT